MILTLLLLWSMVTAQQQPPPAANDLGDSGVIKGTVVNPDGRPVEGAIVYVEGDNDPPISRPDTATTNANGDFVLDHVIPRKVKIHAYKASDYYPDVVFAFNLPPKEEEFPEVEVKPGQTVTGVKVQLMQKAAKLHLNVRDADTKELIPGIGLQFCREDHPTYCIGGGGLSDRDRFMPVGVGISIKIEADDGLHEKWEYRNPKTRSPFFRVKSGETEVMDVFLRKKKK